MEDRKVAELLIQSFKTLISVLSFASLLITFINAISAGGVLSGLPLTLLIYYTNKFVEYLDRTVFKKMQLSDKTIKLNLANLVVGAIFSGVSLVFCFINVPQLVLMIFAIVNLVVVIYYLINDVIDWIYRFYVYIKY